MTIEEKLSFIERVLNVEPYTLNEDTALSDINEWDSLTILNLQIELTAFMSELTFDDLRKCVTVSEVCSFIS